MIGVQRHSEHPRPIATGDRSQDLVLLHGWGSDYRIWEPVLPQLRRYFRLHVVDLPGYGHRHSEVCPADIGPLVDLLLPALPEQAAYIGWSLGGTVASWIAAHHPQRVSALVTVASNPSFVARENWPNAMGRDQFQDLCDDWSRTRTVA